METIDGAAGKVDVGEGTDLQQPRNLVLGMCEHGIDQRRETGADKGVLGRRAGIGLASHDIYVNLAGGLAVDEPGLDLPLALALLDGEIARKDGALDAAIVSFRRAADIEKRLPYTEPAYWHQPVSHYLGAALLQAGRPAEAEAVYRDSLTHYRRDGWALFGLAQALERQGKTAEAAAATAAHKQAFRMADITLTSSRF